MTPLLFVFFLLSGVHAREHGTLTALVAKKETLSMAAGAEALKMQAGSALQHEVGAGMVLRKAEPMKKFIMPKVEDVVTEATFKKIFPRANGNYSYQSFLDGAALFPTFLRAGDEETRKREAAMFFAQVAHETNGDGFLSNKTDGGLIMPCMPCNLEKPCGTCDSKYNFGGNLNVQYYGRGALQLTWLPNYEDASDFLGVDLIGDPDMVNREPKIMFASGIWFWMTQHTRLNISCHQSALAGSYSSTSFLLDGHLECGAEEGSTPYLNQQHRIKLYKAYSKILNVTVAEDLECDAPVDPSQAVVYKKRSKSSSSSSSSGHKHSDASGKLKPQIAKNEEALDKLQSSNAAAVKMQQDQMAAAAAAQANMVSMMAGH